MTLSPGVRLGPYELLAELGSGGMGQVFLARDTRLARDVALKVLHEGFSTDSARLKRFENEARSASALNHPNIVTIYEVGSSDSVSWIAMERVEGTTLRQVLSSGALPVKRLVPIAVQIAEGLARAHEAGIVHRDLKLENVMLTKDERVKILDFGLARLAPTGEEGGDASRWPTETGTFPGVVLGTVGYMSPEQAQGAALDYRSDQFSFGCVLYEMATGKRAFQGKSAIDTLAAIINLEPEPIETSNPRIPGPLRWIVERCLSKEPSHRYTSTQDLARELGVVRDHLADLSGASAPGARAVTRRLRLSTLLFLAAVLAGIAGLFVEKRARARPIPAFQRLTFGRGDISSARFAPDSRTIVYSAAWDGAPARLYSTRTDGRDSSPLALPAAHLASISSEGEIAMVLGRPDGLEGDWVGTLARVPLTGGSPRELIEGVYSADWSPDGKTLAIAHEVGGKHRLEFPIGKVLYETTDLISGLRLSPDGNRVAFFAQRNEGGLSLSVEVVDLGGSHSVLSPGWKRVNGLAWSANGREVWFSANKRGWQRALHAVTQTGKVRVLLRMPSLIVLEDVARDGRVLASLVAVRTSMRAVVPGESRERDLSWHDGSYAKDLTPDGRTLLFDEAAEGEFRAIYIRSTDGSPAKLIGDGRSMAISSDGQWVASNASGRGSEVVLLPTGAGEPQIVDSEGHRFTEATFFPDGKRILLLGDGGPAYVKDLPAGKLHAVAPEGTGCKPISPDGKEVACPGPQGEGLIYAIEGGSNRPIPGFQDGDRLLQWSPDGRALFVCRFDEVPMKIFRLDLATGRRELWRELTHDPGTLSYYFAMTPDGKSYAYSSSNSSMDLYLVTGVQ